MYVMNKLDPDIYLDGHVKVLQLLTSFDSWRYSQGHTTLCQPAMPFYELLRIFNTHTHTRFYFYPILQHASTLEMEYRRENKTGSDYSFL